MTTTAATSCGDSTTCNEAAGSPRASATRSPCTRRGRDGIANQHDEAPRPSEASLWLPAGDMAGSDQLRAASGAQNMLSGPVVDDGTTRCSPTGSSRSWTTAVQQVRTAQPQVRTKTSATSRRWHRHRGDPLQRTATRPEACSAWATSSSTAARASGVRVCSAWELNAATVRRLSSGAAAARWRRPPRRSYQR